MAFWKSCAYFLLIGIASHYIGEALPAKWLKWDRFLFRERKWEKKGEVYERIRIQDWKDHMPDMSRVMKDMVPKKVGICPHSEDVWILVTETCRAEAVHWGICLCAPVIYLFWWNWMGVLLSSILILGNLPFIMIQRYNRPTLIALAKRLEVREERKRNACAHSVG